MRLCQRPAFLNIKKEEWEGGQNMVICTQRQKEWYNDIIYKEESF
jgi:hypothetical protein